MTRGKDKEFKFFVNDVEYEVAQQFITGAQIKAIAKVDMSFELFLEEPGHDKPDKQIKDTDSIDLGSPGVEKFYTVPVATYGGLL